MFNQLFKHQIYQQKGNKKKLKINRKKKNKKKKNRKTNKANTKPKTKTQKHPKGGSPTDPKQIYRAKARAENTAKRRKG